MKGLAPRPPAVRLMNKFLVGDDCWEWTANKNNRGYGLLHVNGSSPKLAHRLMYETLVGPIPEGLQLDHLCRNRACVRPDHLEPVTNAENARRGTSGAVNSRRLRSQTHCKRGHLLEIVSVEPWRRRCQQCNTENMRRYRAAKKGAI